VKTSDEIFSNYDEIITKTGEDASYVFNEIDKVLEDIRKDIKQIDPEVFCKRNELLVAIRLVEAFRIFNWIKVCLACGSYQSVFRELRFMIDGIAQACYIDLNHIEASLESKLEVYKALEEMGGLIGGALFDRIKGLNRKQELKDVYSELSRFMHPSIEESRARVGTPPAEKVVDSLKFVRYNQGLLDQAIDKCRQVWSSLIFVNDHFVKECLKKTSPPR
jgi:hypothetical protein